MENASYEVMVARQKEYFRAGVTKTLQWRKEQLAALQRMLCEQADAFRNALWNDLRKPSFEADVLEIQQVVHEAQYASKRLATWMKPQKVKPPRAQT